MKHCYIFLIFSCVIFSCTQKEQTKINQPNFAIAIHGGAGVMPKGTYTPEEEAAYREILKQAVQKGYDMLARGDSGADVVVAVIKIMEDSPLFNAGKGAVFTNTGEIKMDAAIMNGRTLDAGSVNNVQRIKNPIEAARMVMDNSKYIMFNGAGAESFAIENGITMVNPSYFYTQHQYLRWKSLKDSTDKKYIPYVDSIMQLQNVSADIGHTETNFGTVGCVVLDKYGNLYAGTSTGGLMNKKYNRIGDSPVIGAGTYANNNTCAISCTGTGEDFIKTVAAKTVSDLMEYKAMTLDEATNELIHVDFLKIKGDGGLIAVDKNGNISFQYNSDGMFRAKADATGKTEVFIYEN